MSQNTVISPKTARKNSPDHFVETHSPSESPATQRQGRSSQPRPPREGYAGGLAPDDPRQPLAAPVAVDHERGEPGQREERHDHVEDAGARQREVRALDREQQRRDAAEDGRAEHPPRDPADDEDRQRAEHARRRSASRTRSSVRTATRRSR